MAEIVQPIQITPTATSGKYSFYPKTDGYYMLDPNGVETKIGAVQSIKVFGDSFQEVEKEVPIDLSTLTPTVYLSLVTPNLPLGKYRVGYKFAWSYDDVVGNSAHIALYDNGVRHNTTDISMETKNIFDIPEVGTFLYLDAVSGVHTLEIKFNCDNISDTVSMKSAYIEIWRVA